MAGSNFMSRPFLFNDCSALFWQMVCDLVVGFVHEIVVSVDGSMF